MMSGSRGARAAALGVPRRVLALGASGVLACSTLALGGGCGGQSSAAGSAAVKPSATAASVAAKPAPRPRPRSTTPAVSVPAFVGSQWTVVARLEGRPIAWLTQRGGITLMRFDAQHSRLALHAGSVEPGGGGWRYGSRIEPSEIHRVIAGFNGGFKLTYGSVGFVSYGRVAVALSSGLASIVTYTDGSTQIGSWHAGVPAAGKPIASVRQNLRLLVDHGAPSPSAEGCALSCWGATLGGGVAVARSALGIDGEGRLVWAGGESLSPVQLAGALVAAGAQRAVELDINPFWVAGYLYEHHASGPVAQPVVPGQHGIEGQLLGPDTRDFFVVSVR